MDNILAYKVEKDFVKFKKLRALLLKLDHFFLWDLLRSMGFGEKFISLVKGLVCNGTSTHVNGLSIEDSFLERGVR